MNIKKRGCSFIALLLSLAVLGGYMALPVEAAGGKTGIGLAEWAFRAYNEGWTYSYGGSSAGAVDCSGLIRSYSGKGGGAKALLDASSVNGSVSDMPRIHGLGLWCEGHAGVYVGKNKDGTNMAIDMRNSRVNVVYAAMNSRYYSPWVKWFKVSGLSYPTTGWYEFRGNTYYYKNGEFCVGAVKVDGKTYDFGKSGALIGEIDPGTLTTTKKTTTTVMTTTTTTTTTTATTTTVTAPPEITTTTQEPTAAVTTTEITTTQSTTTAAPTEKTTTSGKQTTTSQTTAKRTTSTRKSTTAKSAATKSTKKKTTTGKSSTTVKASRDTTSTTSSAKRTTVTTATTSPDTYISYEGGMKGEGVSRIQQRLYALGYYDQDITDYYGSFTRDAVKAFQKAIGVLPTGIADEATQRRLFADDAPAYDEALSLMNDADYQMDDAEETETLSEEKQEASVPVIADSEGIVSLSMTANPYGFTRTYGESGPLQTMGVFSYQSPSVVFYRDGESYSVTEDVMESLQNCVFL
ncbi:MAG: peptidoglycan-binding protein [Clostridia bacterium]|nr:peptidoglycan-binding protein [Clostridia bacterium]